MATLNLVLDKRRVKKDSTYPVVFRLTANRKQGHEYGNSVTGIYLEQFDNDIVDKMNQELINYIIY